jgi:DNA repair protein RecN (Recombination protein N)
MAALIQELRIEDFAIVDRLELSLEAGLTVLTGETGAGKSILIGALKLLLGGRSTAELVRSGASRAVVEALVSVNEDSETAAFLRDKDLHLDDGEMVIRRVINKNGRSRVSLNGQLITVGMLSDIMRPLIDISGQHEHVALLDQDRHVDRIDEFGLLRDLTRSVADTHASAMGFESALRALQIDDSERARREDYLRFQLEEIEEVDPQPDELESLETERRRLFNANRLVDGAKSAESALYSADGSLVEILGGVQHRLVELARLDDRVEALSTSATTALAELEDLSRSLERYAERIEFDPLRLTEIDDRLDALRKLVRKHGGSLAAVLAVKNELAEELDGLFHDEARQADLQAALAEAQRELSEAAVSLSAARKTAATQLERAAEKNLRALAMPEARLQIRLVRLKDIGAKGAERAEILIAPNPGEAFRPLHKTASGGELSRLLLAFKQILADADRVGAYVFDEVDSGIGGAVADVVGKKLKAVSEKRQVLTITHLAQVASYADQHFCVRKHVEGGRTVSRVDPLSEPQSLEELARMLGGAQITDRTRKLAAEMRASAKRAQKPELKRGKPRQSSKSSKGGARA